MLAMEKADERNELGGGDYCCEWIRQNWNNNPRLHYYAWEKAIEDGLIKTYRIPPKVVKGYCMEHNILDPGEDMTKEQYFEVLNILEWKITSERKDYPEQI